MRLAPALLTASALFTAAAPASAQWQRIDTNGLPVGGSGIRVASVAATESAVFVTAGQPNTLWRSTDDGTTWARVTAVPAPASGVATVYAAGRTVLVQETAPSAQLHVSTDGGATWTSRAATAPFDVPIATLAHPVTTSGGRSHAFVAGSNPNRLHVTHDDFATTAPALAETAIDQIVSNGRVFLALPLRTNQTMTYQRSLDGGRTWSVAYTGALAADTAYPSRDSLLVFRLTPSGTNFTQGTIFGSRDATAFPALDIVPSGPSTVIESSPEHSAVYHTFRLSVQAGRASQTIRSNFPAQRFGTVSFVCHGDGGTGTNRALSSRYVYLMSSCDETGASTLQSLWRHPVSGASVAAAPAVRVRSAGLSLERPAPHPVRGAAGVYFHLDVPAADARLVLRDALGRTVRVLHEGTAAAGDTRAVLDTRGLAAGVYAVTLTAGGQAATQRVVVLD